LVGILSAVGGVALLVSLAFEFEYDPDLYVADHDLVALAFRIPLQIALLMLVVTPIAFVASLRARAWIGWPGRVHGALLAVSALVAVGLAGYFGLVGHFCGV